VQPVASFSCIRVVCALSFRSTAADLRATPLVSRVTTRSPLARPFSAMESLLCAAVWAVTLAVAMASILWAYRWWSHPKANGQLPPGSLGFPLLGETLQFFAPNPTCDVSPFVKERLDRS
jgi:hypothetical protein